MPTTAITTQKKVQQELTKVKKQLLAPMVNDQQILEILSNDQNFNKLANRLDYKAILMGETMTKANTQLATAERQGTTLQQAIKELNEGIKTGEQTKTEYEGKIKNKLKVNNWYNIEEKEQGFIKSIKLEITIRRG